MPRHAAVHVDLGAIRHNASLLVERAAPARLCAVVKADGYGHGSVAVAEAALAAGAHWLGVALVEEGIVLRSAGVRAPTLVLSEPPDDAMAEARAADLTPTVYTAAGIASAARAVDEVGGRGGPWGVHLKVDTGMHRVGAAPSDIVALATAITEEPRLTLAGVNTHLAVADEPDRDENRDQIACYTQVLRDLAGAGIDPGVRHAANSAGLLARPDAHFDLVRTGIALYGIPPNDSMDRGDLRPAMSVTAEVTLVKGVSAGEGVSYGLHHVFDEDAVLATVPLGYADGVSRRLGLVGGEVLIGGVRRPMRGVVTMDQFVVEVTHGPPVAAGDEVVLLGRQGDDEITANEWGARLDTIGYEVVCGFRGRIPRTYHGR